mmetsp:Transcript_30324/g.40288  ORF Transcript_30324/g.40288 Transcript_30324/m.40288 type:complete len:442 (+) Transcript_30324:246-1571(+)
MRVEFSLKSVVVEDWLSHVNVELDMLGLVVGIDELRLAHEWRTHVAQGGLHDGHPGDVRDGALMGIEHSGDLGALPNDAVVDVDLILDRDARRLPQTLDSIRDLAAETLALELGGDLCVEHDGGGTLGLAAPLLVSLHGISERLHDLEHAHGHLVAVDIDAALAQVALDLIIRQLGKRSLESLVELLLEGLTHELVVGLNGVLDVGILVLGQLKLNAVQLILDVVLEACVAIEDGLVGIDESDLGQRVLHGDDLAAADQAAHLNGGLHALHSRHDLFVNERIVEVGHLREVDRILVQRVSVLQAIAQVLEEVLANEGGDWRHELGCAHEHVEQNGEGGLLVLNARLTLHAGAVESHVPVGKVLEEGEHVAHDVVQAIVVHLLAHILDHVLGAGHDVLVEVVRVGALEHGCARLRVEHERFACARFEARNVLNAEAVGVEPG